MPMNFHTKNRQHNPTRPTQRTLQEFQEMIGFSLAHVDYCPFFRLSRSRPHLEQHFATKRVQWSQVELKGGMDY
ncbi:hypothetical protein SCLCIDRAFT_1214600 [Scleroderma citrinum Foug A]|uniref:Uncharacterized protein n=1 Tax=Scleroderma citrinum Foug A TaxID=1036808 RepID=A0A0C2ZMJ7_9AGAM|nr:hypothetical protein SCLCIDRAFT_1214600 [Scleroderma citrinum Foug A]